MPVAHQSVPDVTGQLSFCPGLPARPKQDTWAALRALKLPGAETFASHVSLRSTAVHLESHGEEPEL